MKPVEGNYATNAINNKVAGINIDQSRISFNGESLRSGPRGLAGSLPGDQRTGKALGLFDGCHEKIYQPSENGRWPANLIHDGSTEIKENFPDSSCKGGNSKLTRHAGGGNIYSECNGGQRKVQHNDKGSASRFFKECK